MSMIASGIVGTLMFGILLLLRPITQKLFSKTWHYYSLFVPLFFLLGGTLLAPNLTIERPSAMPEINIAANTSQEPFQVPYVARPTIESAAVQASPTATPSTIHINPLYIIMLWIFGAVLFAVVNIKKYLQYRSLLLSNARFFETDCQLPVFISSVAHTPLLLGLIKPVIVLPNIHFNNAELDIILAHELIHYTRKDLFWKVLGLMANTIHWYNPAVYIFNRQLSIFCELSCDEKVVSKMDTGNRKFYGETILQVLQHSTVQRDNILLATSLCNSQKNIKRRLKSMMSTKKTKKYMMAFSLAVAVLVIGGGFVISHLVNSAMPVYAAPADLPNEPTYTVAETVPGEPTRNIYYQGVKVGVETTEYAETVYVEAEPIIFSNNYEMLKAVQEEMGNIMWPTYIPEGFESLSMGILNPKDFSQHPDLFSDECYKHLNILNAAFFNGEEYIRFWVSYFQSYVPSRNPYSLDLYSFEPWLMEHESLININGFQATVGHPTYPYWLNPTVTLFDTNNGLHFANPYIAEIPFGGTSYQFAATYDSGISEDDLIRMAESLVNISALLP